MVAESDAELVRSFHAHLKHSKMRPASAALYRDRVLSWLRAGGHTGHVDEALLRTYIAGRRQACSAQTIKMDLTALRRFYRFAVDCGHAAPGSEAKVFKWRHVPQRLVRTLDPDQVAAVLAAPDVETWIGFRDAVMLWLIAETGLRPGEMEALSIGHLIDDRTLYIGHTPRRSHRYTPISDQLYAALTNYINRRCEVRARKRSALFVTSRGFPLRASGISKIVSAHMRTGIGQALGVGTMASNGKPWQGQYAHLLRATLVLNYIAQQVPAPFVAKLVGYSDLASLTRYESLNLGPLRAAIALHPRGKRAD